MKTIGLIGGTTWVSTIDYYRIINRRTQDRLGESHSAQIILYSLDFEIFKRMGEANKWTDAVSLFVDAAKKIESAGAACLLLCANTPHKMAAEIQQEISIPLIHIAIETGKEVKKSGIRKVGLLGTAYTMKGEFYRNSFAEFSIDLVIPDDEDSEFVHSTIYSELGKEIFKPETKYRYLEIIRKFEKAGCEGVILGCTEIPLLIKPDDCSLRTFDTTAIHANAAVDFALTAN